MKEFLTNISKNYFPGLCEEYSPGSSDNRSSTRVRMQGILSSAREFRLHSLFMYNACLQTFRVLFPYSISNCRRVSYEEVRLPPTSNQRCDLYVDDEVEVRLRKPVYFYVIELQKVSQSAVAQKVHSSIVFLHNAYKFLLYQQS